VNYQTFQQMCPACSKPYGLVLQPGGNLTVAHDCVVKRQRNAFRDALKEIADMPTAQRNPDGVDKAAATMKTVAKDALKAES
jgi:hypothetical protein